MDAGDHTGLYPIGVVEHLTGLTARQIRYYEAKGLLVPQRTPGRQRLYSDADVERLRLIKAMMARGMTLQSVREQLEHGGTGAAPAVQPVAGTPRLRPRDAWDETRLPGQRPLTSVYPVINRAALLDRLGERRYAAEIRRPQPKPPNQNPR